jgi:hypothetical protein
MIGVGPGANLRKKNFEAIKGDAKFVLDHINGHNQPAQVHGSAGGYLDHLNARKKDVANYCGVAGTQSFKQHYDKAIALLAAAKSNANLTAQDVAKIQAELKALQTAGFITGIPPQIGSHRA